MTTTQHRSVFLDAEGLEQCDMQGLREVCGELRIFGSTEAGDVIDRIGDASLVIVNKVRITKDILQARPGIRLICVVATGTDCIDLQAAREAGVVVCNCRGYGTDSVVQHVFSVILALHTNLLTYVDAVRKGRWQKSSQFCFLDYPITELKGKVLGIVGYGTLGKGVASIARAFGMEVVVIARPGSSSDTRPALCDVLSELDVLTIHCPLTDETRGLIGEKELAQMKPTAFLVNAARGGIVDEAALVAALRAQTISGAAVDVLTVEPPREGNPLLEEELPNLIVTPHIAWASSEARQRLVDQTVENIYGWLRGQPLREVGKASVDPDEK